MSEYMVRSLIVELNFITLISKINNYLEDFTGFTSFNLVPKPVFYFPLILAFTSNFDTLLQILSRENLVENGGSYYDLSKQ